MDLIRSFLQRIKASPSDEELGRRSSVYADDGKSMRGESEDQLQVNEKLREFRMLVGITTHPSFKAPRGYNPKQRPVVTSKGRPAPNLGIYPTVVQNEFKSKKKYRNTSLLINCCLGLQIVVAAALTALGASASTDSKGNGNNNSKIVTAFGGINTVIAGFLTYLKGSGLPNRLKYYHQQWARVREYIEARERDLGIALHAYDIDIHKEMDIIRTMFDEVKSDIEASTPDRFVGSTSSKLPILGGGSSLGSSDGGVTGQLKGLRDARSKVEELVNDLDGSTSSSEVDRARERLTGDVSILKTKLQQKLREVEALERGIEADVDAQVKEVRVMGEKRVENFVEEAKELGDMEKDVEAARIGAQIGVKDMTDTFRDERL